MRKPVDYSATDFLAIKTFALVYTRSQYIRFVLNILLDITEYSDLNNFFIVSLTNIKRDSRWPRPWSPVGPTHLENRTMNWRRHSYV